MFNHSHFRQGFVRIRQHSRVSIDDAKFKRKYCKQAVQMYLCQWVIQKKTINTHVCEAVILPSNNSSASAIRPKNDKYSKIMSGTNITDYTDGTIKKLIPFPD